MLSGNISNFSHSHNVVKNFFGRLPRLYQFWYLFNRYQANTTGIRIGQICYTSISTDSAVKYMVMICDTPGMVILCNTCNLVLDFVANWHCYLYLQYLVLKVLGIGPSIKVSTVDTKIKLT